MRGKKPMRGKCIEVGMVPADATEHDAGHEVLRLVGEEWVVAKAIGALVGDGQTEGLQPGRCRIWAAWPG